MSSPISVMIADDHPIFRKGLCEVIESDPSLRLVGQAATGDDALRLIGEPSPAVAILDINMPRKSGLQVAQALRDQPASPRLVLLTMYEDEDLFD